MNGLMANTPYGQSCKIAKFTDTTYLVNAIRAAAHHKINTLIIEPTGVRADNGDLQSTVIILSKGALPFGNIGINDVLALDNKIKLMEKMGDMHITIEKAEDADYAQSLCITAGGASVEHLCVSPAALQAPNQINDTLNYNVSINRLYTNTAYSLCKSLQTDTVEIVADGNQVYYHNNPMTVVIGSCDNDIKFNHIYPAHMLDNISKLGKVAEIQIGARPENAILHYVYLDLDIYWLSENINGGSEDE